MEPQDNVHRRLSFGLLAGDIIVLAVFVTNTAVTVSSAWSVVLIAGMIGVFVLGAICDAARSKVVAYRLAVLRSGLLLGAVVLLGTYTFSAPLLLIPTMLGWPLLAHARSA